MDILPKSSPVSTTQNNALSGSKPVILLLIFIIVAIAALAVFFLLQKPTDTNVQQFTNVNFENQSLNTSYLKFIEDGISRKNYENIGKAFELLRIDYSASPTAEKREVLSKLAKYASSNFPLDFEKAPLVVTCLDSECPVVADVLGLSDLKTNIQNSDFLDDETKIDFLQNVDSAMRANAQKNEDGQFAALSSIYLKLKEIWQADKEAGVKILATEVLEKMRAINPEKIGPILDKNSTFNIDQ